MIEVTDLAKSFTVRRKAGRIRRVKTEIQAVNGISMSLAAGELVGYLGPNGAGKSTTIKMMCGILAPTSGSVRVDGLVPLVERKALAQRIGVVFGQRSNLWWDLPLEDSFDLLRHLYRVRDDRYSANLTWLSDLFDLGPLLTVPVRQLSLGQRMRGEIAGALLHDPTVVFLDEPTIGLDVVSKHAVREAVLTLQRERGTTILLTTHDLGDVQRLCQRVMIIDHGRVISDGSLDDLVRQHQPLRTLVIDLEYPLADLDVDGLTVQKHEGLRYWLQYDPVSMTAAQAIARVSAVAPVRDLSLEEPEIEDIIRRVYGAPDVDV